MFKIYILNHPEFKKRLEIISSELNNQSIKFEIVDKFSPGDFDYESITNTDYNHHRDILIEQIKGYSYFNNPNKVSPGSISLVLKHMECWKYQILNNYDYILILEDDCEIPNYFNNLLRSIDIEIKNKSFDLIMLGDFLDFKSETDDFISYNKLYKTRCTHAYIININSAKIMLDGFKYINNSIDFKMNEVIQINDLKVAWMCPGLKQIN
jgi:GR25 family glycosyltransferase involved in LPS biosynthesis